jgi:general stress protein 26
MKLRHLTLFLMISAAGCRTAAPVPNSPLDAARAIMLRSGLCALITLGDDGQPQARTMDPSAPDDRMAVYFVTNPSSRKVRQLQKDPRVTLYYYDDDAVGYVTLLGTARPITDPAEKRQRWQAKWAPHYPGGADASAIYEVLPKKIEVVSIAWGVVGDPETWEPPAIDFE